MVKTGETTRLVGCNVSLGVSGANYWNMDIPLAVDFASATRMARGYFIADGRRDPYGMKKIPEGNGPHQKPFARPLAYGECIFVRKGAGAFAARVAWVRDGQKGLIGQSAQLGLRGKQRVCPNETRCEFHVFQ